MCNGDYDAGGWVFQHAGIIYWVNVGEKDMAREIVADEDVIASLTEPKPVAGEVLKCLGVRRTGMVTAGEFIAPHGRRGSRPGR